MEFHDLMLWARDFLAAVTEQDRGRLRGFFTPGAAVYWPNTGEKFSLEDYLTANCEYPGQWRGQLLRAEGTDAGAVVAARVWEDGGPSCHVVSFLRFDGTGQILEMTEFWGDDGPPPRWRQKLGLGRNHREKTEG